MKLLLVVIAVVWLGACGAPEASTSAEVSLAPEAPQVFGLHGVPGPWSRAGASRGDFDRAARVCVVRSREARAVGAQDKSDAAYRAFLECMSEGNWKRIGAS